MSGMDDLVGTSSGQSIVNESSSSTDGHGAEETFTSNVNLTAFAQRQPVEIKDRLFPNTTFDELAVEYDNRYGAIYCRQRHTERANFTLTLLQDLLAMQEQMREQYADGCINGEPVNYWVLASAKRNIFNFGGDLIYFVELLERRDRDGMAAYAKACIDACHSNYENLGLPITTISLLSGDALGGGLEAALSCDVVIAERSAQVGVPESVFGLFPGMGAYSFISRRVGPRVTEHMILSGRVYSAAELHEMGVIDIIAEDGEGEATLKEYFRQFHPRFATRRATFDMRRIVSPVPYEEMERITDLWVDVAMSLGETDLKKMRRLARAQLAKAGKTKKPPAGRVDPTRSNAS